MTGGQSAQGAQNPNVTIAESMARVVTFQNATLMIPTFNGNNMTFNSYRQKLENAKRSFPDDELRLVQIAVSKLQGKALEALDVNDPKLIKELLDSLKPKFQPRHPFSFYQGRISNLCKFPEESVCDYGTRAKKYLRCAINAIKAEREENAEAVETQLNKDIIFSFLRGLPTSIENYLEPNKAYASLDDAIAITTKIERSLQDKREVMNEMERERKFYKNSIAVDEKLNYEENRNTRDLNSGSEGEYENRRRNQRRNNNDFSGDEGYQKRTFYRDTRRPDRYQQNWKNNGDWQNQQNQQRQFNRPRNEGNWSTQPQYSTRREYAPQAPRMPVLFCRICNMNDHNTEECRRRPRGDGRELNQRNNFQQQQGEQRPFQRDNQPPWQREDRRGPRPPMENQPNNDTRKWIPREPTGPGAIPKRFTQTNEPPRRVNFVEKHQVLWQPKEKRDLPLVYATLKEYPKNKLKMVVDTASGINVIKISAVPEEYPINTEDFIKIHGISPQGVETLGSVNLELFDIPSKYYVIPDYLPLPADGLLGLEFLHKSQAQVSFYHQTVNFNSNPIKPYKFEKPLEAEVRIPPRSRMPTQLYVKNKDIINGYLPRVDLPDGVYAGESIVNNMNGICHTLMINTNSEEVRMMIPPREILEYERLTLSETESEKELIETNSREETLINLLKLDHLTQEEKEHIIDLVKPYSHVFQHRIPW